MNRWLEKIGNAPGDELTKLTKGGSVSSVSAPPGAFDEKNASGNRWLAKLGKDLGRLEEAPSASKSTVCDGDPALSAVKPAPAGEVPAPLHEIEFVIGALTRGVGHDLGHDLEARLRRAMARMSRRARAELAAAVDDAFEAGANIEQARLSISRHLPGGGNLEPATAEQWVERIAKHCPVNHDDRRYLGDLLRLLPDRRRVTAACWYMRAWLQAADAEPLPHHRDNAGRRAANATLRPVRRGGGQ
ncbi:hypothetical protein [Chromohalobacter israelensis]